MRAVIFDMDGVLIDSHSIAQTMLRECGLRNGIPLDEADLAAWTSVSGAMFWTAMKEKHRLNRPIEYYREDYDVEEEIRRYASLQPILGVVPLIERLFAAGMLLAVGTSGSRRRMEAVLDRFGLAGRFSATVAAGDVRDHKPSGEVFVEAARRLEVRPDQCLVIEDTQAGLNAARDATMKVVGYVGPGSARHDLSSADLVTDDLASLTLEVLRALIDDDRTTSHATS